LQAKAAAGAAAPFSRTIKVSWASSGGQQQQQHARWARLLALQLAWWSCVLLARALHSLLVVVCVHVVYGN
jgi:hypothetical protein